MMIDRLFHRTGQGDEENRAPLGFILRRITAASDRTTWLVIAVTSVFVIAGSVTASLAPLALKVLIDRLSSSEMPRTAGLSIFAPVALYVGALGVQRLLEQIQTYLYARAEQRLVRNFSAGAYAHILALPFAVHLEKRSGALAQSLSQGVLGLRMIATHFVLTIAPVAIQLIVAGLVLAGTLGATLGLLLFAGLLLYCAVFAAGIARLRVSVERLSAAQVEAGGLATDGFMNVEAIKAYTAERRFAARYDMMLEATEASGRDFAWRRLQNGIAVALVFVVSLTGILIVAGAETTSGRMTVGAFVLVNTYVLQLVRPVEALGFAVRDIGQGLAYLKAIAAVLSTPTERSVDAAGGYAGEPRPAGLQFDRVSFGFGERKTIADVSFKVEPGTMVGIVGPSGAGKSSLLRLILRLYDPWSGTIMLDGIALPAIPLEVLRGQIALVSQDTILFHDTIAANIRFAVDEADEADIAAAAERAHLSTLLADLPDGLDTLVGERGLKLSGGEKQRVSIARAVLKEARLIVLDEATAALDAATERAVWTAMQGLAQDATTLVVTHRLSAVSGAHQILVLDHGQIVERGTHAELLALDGLYARLWRSQEAVGQPAT